MSRKYGSIELEIVEDYQAMSKKAAVIIAEIVRKKNQKGEKIVLGLATGNTMIGLYKELASIINKEKWIFQS